MKKMPVECYQRIVGYFRPLSQANGGMKAQIKDRYDSLNHKFIYRKNQNDTQAV
jgi:hypothetical protein